MELPLFPIAQALALGGAVVFVRARLPISKGRAGVAAAFGIGAVLGALTLGPLLRIPRVIRGEIALFDPGWLMAYGALGGAVLGTVLAARATRLEKAAVLDRIVPALGWLVLCGRLGCFFAGCCFGDKTDLPWATSHGRHPTALYEAAIGLILLIFGLFAKSRRCGHHFAAAAALYAAGRFAVELVRDDPRPMGGPLSLPQWLSTAVLAALTWHVVSHERTPDAASQ